MVAKKQPLLYILRTWIQLRKYNPKVRIQQLNIMVDDAKAYQWYLVMMFLKEVGTIEKTSSSN
ncbi:Hypothetical protein PHPALM_13978 [Phytophthora palmivora]|uniref:Uncharacterized protein n=1 Tax=Phytophthora palmivora TaxID=4796 RepID=A0A2P4XVY9_9STRA|nr:Hypothetical protein PHPALM_13978 [Phytophthora palmivora]